MLRSSLALSLSMYTYIYIYIYIRKQRQSRDESPVLSHSTSLDFPPTPAGARLFGAGPYATLSPGWLPRETVKAQDKARARMGMRHVIIIINSSYRLGGTETRGGIDLIPHCDSGGFQAPYDYTAKGSSRVYHRSRNQLVLLDNDFEAHILNIVYPPTLPGCACHWKKSLKIRKEFYFLFFGGRGAVLPFRSADC